MQERLNSYDGIKGGDRIEIGTFHSVCDRILRKYAKNIGFDNSYTIIDQDDAKEIVNTFISDVKSERKKEGDELSGFPNAGKILKINSDWINNMTTMDVELYDNSDISYEYQKDVENILINYNEYKKSRNMFDFDDLLYYCYQLLHHFEHVRQYYDETFQYIMCDEYQDTNVIQDAILGEISRDVKNLAVVGDDNQSIYKFRGARIDNITSFESRHPNCKRVVLVENYRSTQQILDFANSIMAYAVEGIRKDLKGQKTGELPEFIVTDNDTSLAKQIVNDIIRKHKEGIPYSEMAVISRGSMYTSYVEAMLTAERIPFVKYGGMGFFQKKAIKDVLSFVRAETSDKDEVAWLRVLRLYPGIGPAIARKISNDIAVNGIDSLLGDEYKKKKNLAEKCRELHDAIKYMRTFTTPSDLTSHIINNVYKGLILEGIDGKKTTPAEKTRLKVDAASQIKQASLLAVLAEDYTSTREMIDDFILNMPSKKEEEKDKVVVTTIHSAKGLEYDTVYLAYPVQGIFPRTEDEDIDDDKEDRRCLYVAVTRAKNHLYICIPKRVFIRGHMEEARLHTSFPTTIL